MVEKAPESAKPVRREPPPSSIDRGSLHGGDSGWGNFSRSYNQRAKPPTKKP